MLHLFFHLLGVWLLLSQASGTVSPGFLDKVIKVCGRDLVRIKIDICGKILLGDMTTGQEKQRILGSGQSAEIMPSSINKEVDSLNMLESIANLPEELRAMLPEKQPSSPQLQQYVPALKNSNVAVKELNKIIRGRQEEAEDNSHSLLKDFNLNIYSPKNEQLDMTVSEKCCQVGCTRRFIANSC
uniref:Insulin-like domain-containing protein n=1 Tax=Cavia porcellus TaxID=10141 RepID=H0UW18_CAVPO